MRNSDQGRIQDDLGDGGWGAGGGRWGLSI